MRRGEMFILSAPSGTGKTTLIRQVMGGPLADLPNLAYSVSHTTRAPRVGEVDGRDYHFVDEETFRTMVVEDRFLEWAEVHDQLKGTSTDAVLPRLEKGIDVILDIDVQGAEQVIARYPEAYGIFILPPSYADLERRIRGRGLDKPDQIERRLAVSRCEIERYEMYRYVIINDDLTRASTALAAIVLDKRNQLERQRERVQEILRDFDGLPGDDPPTL